MNTVNNYKLFSDSKSVKIQVILKREQIVHLDRVSKELSMPRGTLIRQFVNLYLSEQKHPDDILRLQKQFTTSNVGSGSRNSEGLNNK